MADPSDPIRIGFIGCGLIARSHLRGLERATEATVGPVFDLDPARAEAFAEASGGFVAGGPAEVVERADAIYICTWTSEHAPMVDLVVGSGRSVFCEKPLSTDLATSRALHDAVVTSGVTNQVGLVLRHSPAFRTLRSAVRQSGPLMNIVFRDDQYIPIQGMYGSDWRADPDRAGAGTLLEHSIHDLDLLEWIMGPITSVSARVGNQHGHPNIDDQASVTLVNGDGAQAVLISVWHDVLSRPSQRRVEAFCRDAYIGLEGDWSGPISIDRTTSDVPDQSELGGPALSAHAAAEDGLSTNPDAAFVDAVRAGTVAYPDVTVALRAHELVDAAYRSAAEGGAPVNVAPA